MSARISADVRALFVDLGVEVEDADSIETGLVIDCFEQWGSRVDSRVCFSICGPNLEALRDVELAA
ncbi:hypothetical protein [Amycolatopsis sp. NPDC004772]